MTLAKKTQRDLRPVGSAAYSPAGGLGADWLLCDGSLVNTTDYPLLYAAIGTQYNGGSVPAGQFRLPNCVDRVLVGLDSYGPGQGAAGRNTHAQANDFGGVGGQSSVTLTHGHFPDHTHGTGELAHGHSVWVASLHTHPGHTRTNQVSQFPKTGSTNLIFVQSADTNGTQYASLFNSFPSAYSNYSHSPAGSGQAHENEQPHVGVYVYIKAW